MKKTIILFSAAAIFAVSVFSTIPHKQPNSSSSATFYHSHGGTALVIDPIDPGSQLETGYLLIRSAIDSSMFVIGCDTATINNRFATLLAQVGAGNLTGITALNNNVTNFEEPATGTKEADLAAAITKCKAPFLLLTRIGGLIETVMSQVANR